MYFNEFVVSSVNNFDNLEKKVDILIDFKLNSGFFKKDFNIPAVVQDKIGKSKFSDSLFLNDNEDFFYNKYINNDVELDYILPDHFVKVDSKYKDYYSSDPAKQVINNFFNQDFFLENFNQSGIDFLKDYRDNKYKNYNFDNSYYEDINNQYNIEDSTDLKQFDFKSAKWSFFRHNRSILSFFLKKKIKNKRKFNKFIKNLIKKPFYSFILYFEFSLISICLRSQLFFNENDVNFFLKNKYILINNTPATNIISVLNIGDRLNIVFDKYYYYYYRNVVNNINYSMIKLGNYNFIMDQKKHDFNKQSKSHTPKWLTNLMYFREDIPNYIEVDFLSMSLIILYKPLFNELDFNKLKFLNYFQRHLYNWKSII